jgi:thiol-disulfide isomerase/thioredoxin
MLGRARRTAGVIGVTVIGAVVGLLAVAGCSAGASRSGATDSVDQVGLTTYPAASRQLAPSLTGETLDGQSVSLAGLGSGKVVVLNVWASWCEPCRTESPMLAAAARSLAPEGAVVVGIDEQDTASDARSFVSKTGMGYANLVDHDGALLRKLKMLPQMGIPSTLFLDRHGRVAARVIGAVTQAQVSQVVGALLNET